MDVCPFTCTAYSVTDFEHSILIGASLKGKNMLLRGAYSFLQYKPLLRLGFFDVETYSTVQKLVYPY